MNGDVAEAPISSEPCPICLGPIKQEAYLDQCFHQFCYKCIVQWMKVVNGKSSCHSSSLKCPFCKRENNCIIHSYDGMTFEKHFVNGHREDRSFLSWNHSYRLNCYYAEQANSEETFDVSRYWKFRKYLQPNRWLESWVRREIQALLQEDDVQIIVHHILGVIDSFSKSKKRRIVEFTPQNEQNEFRILVSSAARPFLTARTDRFVQELELFLGSGLNIQAYDEVYALHICQQTVPNINQGPEAHPISPLPILHIFDEDSDGPE